MTRLTAGALALLATLLPPAALAQQRADWGLSVPRPAIAPTPTPPSAAAPSGAAARPWLGIIVTELETADGQAPPGVPGLSIARVATGSPAEAAGLRAGDVLLSLGGSVMSAPTSLVAVVKQRSAGSRLEGSILRDGTTLPIVLILGAQPAGWDEVKRVVARVDAGGSDADDEVDDVLMRFEGQQRRPWLGLTTMDLGPGLRSYFRVPGASGVLIDSVEAGSPAALAGLVAGDIVLALDGRDIASGEALNAALRDLAPAQDVIVATWRDGARRATALRVAYRDVAVWNAEMGGVDRFAAIEAMTQHQRREAARVSAMLGALTRGDAGVAATLKGRAKGHAGEARDRTEELETLRGELSALRLRLDELEADLAQARAAR